MFDSATEKFTKRMDALKANIAGIGQEVTDFNADLLNHEISLKKEVSELRVGSRKEKRLKAELESYEEFLDNIDDIGHSVGLNFNPVPAALVPVPAALVPAEPEPEPTSLPEPYTQH